MGGKKGGGSSHTPVEAKETGRSYQQLKILEVISEGEIYGLVDDMGSVYLDKTPVQNHDGSFNFKNVSMYANIGTQDQDVLPTFNTTEREVSVGVDVRHGKPVTRTITDKNVTRLRMTLGVKALKSVNDKGDTNPTSVTMLVQIKKGNNVRTITKTFNGKYSNPYREMFYIDGLPSVPFQIIVERQDVDSTSDRLQNPTFWSSYTEIIDDQFTYPNTALMGIRIDSEYFSNTPTRNYEVRGLIVDVPVNYDPFTRTYSGSIWNGEFKRAWTDNPAWIFRDLATNERYGMGKRLKDFGVDKWQLYAIAKYCDELVPDGYGGREPRMTCNLWLTDQKQAYEVMNSIASVFRAMPVWNGQQLTAIQDRASDPVWTYTNANVVDGKFVRSRSALKARHNTIHVEYLDKDDFYEKKIEAVTDDVAVRLHGQNIKKVTAYGCTSRGQAYRTGRWILETERLETETITFSVGREGLMHLPYDVIQIADNWHAGTGVGGRVVRSNGRDVVIDTSVKIDDNTYFSYINNQGLLQNVKVHSYNDNTKTITLTKTVNDVPDLTVWSLSTRTLTTGLYRCIGIKENEDGTYAITALQHVPEKEDIVTNGTHFEPRPTTTYSAIDSINAEYDGHKFRVQGVVNNTHINSKNVTQYDIKIVKDGALISIQKGLKSPEIDIENLENGTYEVTIIAKNARGQIISHIVKSFVIDRPPIVTGITVVGGLGNVMIDWNYINEITETEVWASETDDLKTAKLIARVNGSMYSHETGAEKTYYYWLRHVRGVNKGAFDQEQGRKGQSGSDIAKMVEELRKELGTNLVDQIIDVALPARKLELVKTVAKLVPTTYQGAKQVYNEFDGKLYIWNNKTNKYESDSKEVLAEAIKGIITPEQLGNIPTEKLVGTIAIEKVPAIPTNKLTGLLTDQQIQAINASKLTGTINIAHIPSIPTNKLSGQISDTQLQSVPTTKLTGKLTAEQISANAIGANHLATNAVKADNIDTNAVTAVKIASNAITSDKINANAITANKIAGNAIQSTHLSSNSVTANAIASNAITTDKIHANAVTSAKIMAGAINANHIQAGQISTDKLAIGLGGNLLLNPIFANLNASGVPDGWNYANSGGTATVERNTNTNYGLRSYGLPNENCMRLYRTTVNTTHYSQLTQRVAVNRGQWYIASVYMGNHRSVKCELIVQFLNKSGTAIRAIHKAGGNGFTGLENAERVFIKFQAPNDCESVMIYLRQTGIAGTNTNAIMFVARPMLEECTQHATKPSTWVNAGVTSIHGGSIRTDTITAEHIKARAITSIKIASEAVEAYNIKGGTITGDKIVAQAITAREIKNKSLTSDKIQVAELSALTSNLGTVNAGTINGVNIKGVNIHGSTIHGTEIHGSTIRGARLIGATGDFTGTLQVSSTLGAVVNNYSQNTNFYLAESVQIEHQQCHHEYNSSSYTVCNGKDVYREVWRSDLTFTIYGQHEETVLLPPTNGWVISYSPEPNGLLGSNGKVIRAGWNYTVTVRVEVKKNVIWYDRNKRPSDVNVQMVQHKRF